jgi:integrase
LRKFRKEQWLAHGAGDDVIAAGWNPAELSEETFAKGGIAKNMLKACFSSLANARDRDERGLYLQVISPTNRSWLFRYERNGRERWMGLGPLHTFSLEEARERARKARQQLADGIDPIDQRDQEKEAREAARARQAATAVTFEVAARQYFELHNTKWRNPKHRAQFLSTLTQYAFPVFGKIAVAEVDKTLVLKALDPIWRTVPETASRLRGRIEAVLAFATVRGLRSGDNPARWKGHLDHALPARSEVSKVRHHNALPFADLPGFMEDLRARAGIAARALEFTVLTAARTGEVIGAQWPEMDLQNGIWIVPASRMKAKREHRVPLTATMIDLLRVLPREEDNDHVFLGPNSGGLSNMAMDAVLRRMGYKDRATTHGFRSTFRDWTSEMTTFPSEVAEAALAHIVGDKVERAYRRGDVLQKRSALMEAWTAFCSLPANINNNLHILRPASDKVA